MLQNNASLKNLIQGLWDMFWSGGLANPITAIEQITYLLFMRQLDELDIKKIEEATASNAPYTSKFEGIYLPDGLEDKPENYRNKTEFKWSYFTKQGWEDKQLLDHVKKNVFPFIQKLNEEETSIQKLNDEETSFTKYMEDANFVIPKPSLIKGAISTIEDIFVEIKKDAEEDGQAFQDIQGDVYEMLLGEIAQAGKNGQFRTPRHLIKLMVELLEPQLGDTIADPACGTAGYLLGAYQYILTDLVRQRQPEKLVTDVDGFESCPTSTILRPEEKATLENSLFGFDIDLTMVRFGLMNLMMHGIDNPNIERKDTLGKTYNEPAKYTKILANPPFTGKIDKDDINENLGLVTNSTELLFLARISRMLVKNGQAAVIIPEGVLFGSSKANKAAREILLKDNQLEAVISLPAGAFKPYTGVKTAIVVFTKVADNSKIWNTEKVWFYALEHDGYTLDDKRKKLKENVLPEVKKRYKIRQATTYKDRKTHFFVPIDEIQKNGLDLSYNRYKEYEYVEQKYATPKKILAIILALENEILEELNELNEIIG
ncbi:MAG: class I SAM-dependent DNA methyltransferase [Chitinophagales bacterium]